MKLPYEELVKKISEKSGLSASEIEDRIHSKLTQFSGLISKDGAAHIVSNELGINLMSDISRRLKVTELMQGMRNIDILLKVQKIYPVKEFSVNLRSGKVCSLLTSDETGFIRLVFWNDLCDKVTSIKENDTLLVKSAVVRNNNGRSEVHVTDTSEIISNPPGELLKDVKKQIVNERKLISELNESSNFVEIFATIVQVFDLRFYEVCPNCQKRLKQRDASFVCDEHGMVQPLYSGVLNLYLDDGSANIRAVFFKNQVEALLNVDSKKIQEFKSNLDAFSSFKQDLLGKQIIVSGRVNKNNLFDRLEFVTTLVNTQIDLDKEISEINKRIKK